MASEATLPPIVDVGELTDNELRASATLHAKLASSLMQIIRLRTSLLGANHELAELRQRLHDAERGSKEDRHELNACKARLHTVEYELQQTKCELGDLKSGRVDMELRLESAETRLQAAERLLGEYVLKINQLEAAQSPVPGPLTRIDASAATSSNQKRARSPSLEIIESHNPTPVQATSVSVKKSLESASSLYSKCNAMFPPRRSESQASYLPTPPPTSNVKESTLISAKRRKVEIDIDVEMKIGGDLKSNRPASDTTPCANDTANVTTYVPPGVLPVTSLSSDSARTDAPPLHHKTEISDSTDVESTRTDPRDPTRPDRSFSATHRPIISRNKLLVQQFGLMSPTPKETSINSVLSPGLSQLTTTANTPPSSTPSTSTTNVVLSVLPRPSSAQTTIVNALPPSTTTGGAPVPTPNVPTPTRPDNAAPPSPNVIPDLNVRTTERILAPASTTAGACRNDEPPACSTSTTPKSGILDTSTMPPPVASMVQQYLPGSNAEILPIVPTPSKTEVPRAFLVSAYGGASQQWLQIFRKDKHPKGAIERRVVFPQFGLNPGMPSAPGHPGLIFASRHEILEHPPWTVFRKRASNSRKAVWLYLGDYECELVGKMTGMEFSGLAMSVKHEWAKALLGVKKFDVYVSMRARIALRKHGCIPLQDKKKEEALIDEEIDSVKSNTGRPVDAGDIIGALERGDERIDIIRMVCIKYDHAFANDMFWKFVDYKASSASASTTPEPSSSGKKTAGKSMSASAAAVPKQPKNPVLLPNSASRRNRNCSDEEESDTGEIDWDSEEFEPQNPLSKVPSDRKLRPRTSCIITIED